MIRTIIADDQVLLREMLKTMLIQDADIQVIGTAGSGKETIKLCSLYRPDIVLMDIKMPETNGIKALSEIKKCYPETKVLMLTTFEDQESITEAYLCGADGYILKDIKPELLIMAVKCLYNDIFIMSKSVHQYIMKHFNLALGSKLSFNNNNKATEGILSQVELDKTDIKILKLLVEGNSNKDISEALSFSEGTIKNRISRILGITGLKDRTQLVVYALKNNLV